ncbi:hypothetical protein D915_003907 [Fasciola hepatica]|uniref:Uncharacterized protein n=1 Tax=Fasciola hepatica TaxID=6192 RepID=A0A4E0RFG9_FASHE|nr:hypothetical protein D915_003907 [Fasciola hepatica]
MWLRVLLAYLHSPAVIRKLADSYPIRMAARLTIRSFFETKHKITSNPHWNIGKDSARQFLKQVKDEFRRGMQEGGRKFQ